MTPLSLARQLSAVTRYSRDHSIRPESVLEHTGFCVIYCLSIGEEAIAAGIEIDFAVLLKKAILHDVEEAVTGDITRKAKYHNDAIRSALEAFECEAALDICKKVFAPGGYSFKLWREAKKGNEGKIVSLSDYAAVAYHIHNEMFVLGNKGFMRVQKEALGFLDEAIENEQEAFFKEELQYIRRILSGRMPV